MFRRKSPPTGTLKPEGAMPVAPAAPETVASEPPVRSPYADKGFDMSPTKPPSSSTSFKPEIPRRVVEIPGAPARRPMEGMSVSSNGSLPVSGSSHSNSSLSTGATEMRKLIVGRDISLSGEITACDVLVVEGTVEAKLRDGRNIEIAESGLFKGSVEIDEADIAGRFEGDISVRGRLRLRSTGKITGSIRYGELEVEAGGQLMGEIQVMTASASNSVARMPSAPVDQTTTPETTQSSPYSVARSGTE
jgi:cytoskeletal protein CcmA (bactofilin family)